MVIALPISHIPQDLSNSVDLSFSVSEMPENRRRLNRTLEDLSPTRISLRKLPGHSKVSFRVFPAVLSHTDVIGKALAKGL